MEYFGNNKCQFNICLLLTGFYMIKANRVFANEGEAMQLNCPSNRVDSWQSGTNEFLALCEGGKARINTDLRISNRIIISSDCQDLTITNFTKDDAGTYLCFVTKKGKEKTDSFVKHAIHVTLRKLEIDEQNDANLVEVIEGKNLSLTCSLQGGSSNDMLYWMTDNITLKSGKPPILKYTFMADQSDHLKEFTCRGAILKLSYFLEEKVTVDVHFKPTVLISVLSNSSVEEMGKSVIMRQNQHIDLLCLEKNHAPGDDVIFSWLFNKISLENNTNKISLIYIKPEMSGEYICRAQNRAGTHYDSLNITVADIPEMPQNLRVVALKHEIIVKWLAGNSGGILQTLLIEYRNRFESAWNVITITTEGKTSEVIDGLQTDTVYFIRMFSRNILGESNTTDEIIIKTGNHHIVIKSCSWEIGVLSSAAVVVFFLCLCGIKATEQRLCLNMVQNRSNRLQSNANTPETRDAQYDEIDSVYNNVPNANERPELTLINTPIETSSINNINIGNISTDNVETGNVNQDLTQSDTALNILRADNDSVSSSSGDSYLVPSRNYINFEIGFTDELSLQIAEPEFLDGGSSASNSESSETRIKSDHQYETLDATNSVEHYYESTIETY